MENKNKITLEFDELLNELKDNIESVEIYYNPYTTIISENIKEQKI